MSLLDSLVEQRILEAEQRGDFADLPGAGKPLALDEDPLVPDEIRVAYRVLKNAGFVPPEVEEFRTLRELEACVASSEDDENRSRALRKLQALALRLAESRECRRPLALDVRYRRQVLARLR
ncbi:MAG: DnaJ family domain-containing protein [Burkholderiales bacterium]